MLTLIQITTNNTLNNTQNIGFDTDLFAKHSAYLVELTSGSKSLQMWFSRKPKVTASSEVTDVLKFIASHKEQISEEMLSEIRANFKNNLTSNVKKVWKGRSACSYYTPKIVGFFGFKG